MNKQQLRRLGVLPYESTPITIWGQRTLRQRTRGTHFETLLTDGINPIMWNAPMVDITNPIIQGMRTERINENEVDVWVQPVTTAEFIPMTMNMTIERTEVNTPSRRMRTDGTLEDVPRQLTTQWTSEVIDDLASMTQAQFDDAVDTLTPEERTQILRRVRENNNDYRV